jgi:hypothetical protein
MVTVALVPGWLLATRLRSELLSDTGSPLNVRMTSPRSRPAFCAGPLFSYGPLRAEDQHGDRDVPAAEFLEDREPVAAGQHEVEHGGVIRLGESKLRAAVAVPGRVHGVTGLLQPFDEERRDRRVAFDHQQAYDVILR